ncbi:hypothetical protein SEA_GUUELAD_137 [Mycobacterium phage GuuelaD]|uniref:Uncharacterized protein n=1 Tax=Mycobacterium phage GuuelaD TaxID=2015819 RepID=A0A286MQN5_9CAUD|nr:hypothetical protein J4T97_gp104 [Mycobacterium phage GuuelaD]ASW31560.1 hypothetical protein SEA_GUUELAD_137 [Mycobacterium phage GuuelaD]
MLNLTYSDAGAFMRQVMATGAFVACHQDDDDGTTYMVVTINGVEYVRWRAADRWPIDTCTMDHCTDLSDMSADERAAIVSIWLRHD